MARTHLIPNVAKSEFLNKQLMKIDLYNNTETFFKESRQDSNVNQWLRSKGIDIKDLQGHDQISDVITLINIKDYLWHRMNPIEQVTWHAYWDIVYRKGYPLNQKFWKKFNTIVMAIDQREHIMAQRRQQIRTLKNKDQNTQAKGSDQPQVTYTKRDELGCRAVSN